MRSDNSRYIDGNNGSIRGCPEQGIVTLTLGNGCKIQEIDITGTDYKRLPFKDYILAQIVLYRRKPGGLTKGVGGVSKTRVTK